MKALLFRKKIKRELETKFFFYKSYIHLTGQMRVRSIHHFFFINLNFVYILMNKIIVSGARIYYKSRQGHGHGHGGDHGHGGGHH